MQRIMTRDEFEQCFKDIQSWELDGLKFDPEEKELIRQLCMGEITMHEYDDTIRQRDNKTRCAESGNPVSA